MVRPAIIHAMVIFCEPIAREVDYSSWVTCSILFIQDHSHRLKGCSRWRLPVTPPFSICCAKRLREENMWTRYTPSVRIAEDFKLYWNSTARRNVPCSGSLCEAVEQTASAPGVQAVRDRCHAARKDVAVVDGRLTKQIRKLNDHGSLS